MKASPTETRLSELEERFATIGDTLEDSPVRDALSVLHAMVREVARQQTRELPAEGDLTLDDVANLYLTAPPMQGDAQSRGLRPGTPAPDFALPDAQGELVRLSDFRGQPVVLVFYPLDWSPGCSRQLELYQHELDEFARRGAAVVAVSVDSIYSHGAWAAVRGLTFPLLADFHPKGEIARRYEVWRETDGFSDRALYVIDRAGVISHANVSPRVDQLPDIYEVFAALDELAEQGEAA